MSRGSVAVAELTEALETLQSAEQSKEDFLTSAAGNEAVEAELAANAVDPENPTASEIETAIGQVDTDASNALDTDRTNDGSDRVIEAELADAQEAVSNYEAEIAKVDGLEQAIAAKNAAADQIAAAAEAKTEADAAANGAIVTFADLNGTITAANIEYQKSDDSQWDPATDAISDLAEIVENGGSAYDNTGTDDTSLFTVTDGELSAASGTDTLEGLAALQAALQAKVDAEAEVDAAAAADTAADGDLAAITLTADEQAALGEASAADVYTELDSLETAVDDAQDVIDERAELVADAEEAGALAEELEAADQAITDAEDALTDDEADGGFGVNLVDLGGTGTADDDLFVFSAGADTSTGQFGAAGEDKIYIGDSFTRVDLESDAVFTAEQGDVATMEVFFQQSGSDAVLTFEDKAFAGSGSSATEDLTQVTLTGVSVEDLSIENGYITVA